MRGENKKMLGEFGAPGENIWEIQMFPASRTVREGAHMFANFEQGHLQHTCRPERGPFAPSPAESESCQAPAGRFPGRRWTGTQ